MKKKKLLPIIDYNTAIILLKKFKKRIINIKIFKKNEKTKNIINIIKKKKINFLIINKKIIERPMIEKIKNQGFLLLCKKKKIKTLKKIKKKIYVLLEKASSSGNLGRTIRYSYLFGIKNIILNEKDEKLVNYITEKSSVGAINFIKIFKIKNLKKTIEKFKKKQFKIIGLDQKGCNIEHYDFKRKKILLIIGNEIKGIKKKTKFLCESVLSIKTKKKLPLNASDSCLLALYIIKNKLKR